MTVGIDIIEINRLRDNSDFIDKILVEEEIEKSSLESIAGKIAAKEAIIKTGFIKPGEWKRIIIKHLDSGAPIVYNDQGDKIQEIKISISHTRNMAIAIALYE